MSVREASAAHSAHSPDGAKSFFLVRRRGDQLETRGIPNATFGHTIVSDARSTADGIFAHWRWDGSHLTINNDRYGFQPMFQTRMHGDGIAISPSLVALVEQGASTELDIEALAVFFRLGYFLGEDTPFTAIRAVPPNAKFEWANGVLECHGRYPPVAAASDIARDDAIDRYIELFARAMARRAPASPAFAVPISGGRDSRHILLELHRTGHTPTCVSVVDNPPDSNEDVTVGAALCRALGYRHVVVDQSLSVHAAQVRKNRETHFCAPMHGWYLALADFLDGRADCVYDGIAGDVLSQSKFLNPTLDAAFRSRDTAAICDALLDRSISSLAGFRDLLKGPLMPCLDANIARDRLTREVERHLDQPNPAGSFIFWNRTRRAIALAPYSLLKGIPRVYAPFLDHDLFDFLVTLPSRMLLDHRFHDDTIARAYPDFARVPYANGAAPLADDRQVRLQFVTGAARRLVLKRPSRLMRNATPRMRMLVNVLTRGRVHPWVSPLVVYLDQLEDLMTLGAGR